MRVEPQWCGLGRAELPTGKHPRDAHQPSDILARGQAEGLAALEVEEGKRLRLVGGAAGKVEQCCGESCVDLARRLGRRAVDGEEQWPLGSPAGGQSPKATQVVEFADSVPGSEYRFVRDVAVEVVERADLAMAVAVGADRELDGHVGLRLGPVSDLVARSYGRFLEAKLRRADGLALDPQAIIRYLREKDEPRTRPEIASDLGIVTGADQWRKALSRLIEAGLVVASGQTRGRTYAAALKANER